MVTHVDSERLLDHVAVVVILLRCLIEVGYLAAFERTEPDLSHFADERKDPLVFFATLLMQFRLALISNNHSISGSPPTSSFPFLPPDSDNVFQRSLASPTT